MAAVVAKDGKIVMGPGDTHTPIASLEIVSVQVEGNAVGELIKTNGGSAILSGPAAGTHHIGGSVTTGGGITNNTDSVCILFVK